MGFYCPSSFISAVCLRWYLSRKYDETLRVVPWCETRRAACLNSRLPERAEDKLPSSLRSCDIKQRAGLEFGKTVLCTGWNWLNSCVYIDPNNPLITRINTVNRDWSDPTWSEWISREIERTEPSYYLHRVCLMRWTLRCVFVSFSAAVSSSSLLLLRFVNVVTNVRPAYCSSCKGNYPVHW